MIVSNDSNLFLEFTWRLTLPSRNWTSLLATALCSSTTRATKARLVRKKQIRLEPTSIALPDFTNFDFTVRPRDFRDLTRDEVLALIKADLPIPHSPTYSGDVWKLIRDYERSPITFREHHFGEVRQMIFARTSFPIRFRASYAARDAIKFF